MDLHFVAFVNAGGKLYELDGRKVAPVCHGDTSAGSLLRDAVGVVRQFMSQADSVSFNLMALSPPGEWGA